MNNSISTVTGKTKIKIVFLGSQAVGKSSIIDKYIHGRFEETANPTVGIDFLAKNITHKSKNYRLQLWDTAGQERFRSLIPSYLKDANCALIVFDVTSKSSFADTEMWINLFNENKGGEGFIFLVGNKADLDYREVTQSEAKQKAIRMGTPYVEISAKTGQQVEDLFLKVIEVCTEKNIHAANFFLDNKELKESIKQQDCQKEQQSEVKQVVEKTQERLNKKDDKLSIVPERDPVVLRNDKIVRNKEKGTCC